jgi:cobalt/nickel transport system permease protein
MHIHFLDPFRPGESLVHNLDGRVKFLLTVAFILTAALAPVGAWQVYILLLAVILAIEIISGLGLVYVLKRSALAAPFVLAALPLLFTVPGATLLKLPWPGWALSLAGLERFFSLALKSWISVQAAIVMSSTMSFPDLLLAMRALRVPRLLVAVFGLMWRYLFVLADEALRLIRARAARSGQSDQQGLHAGGSLTWRARVAGGMAGNLFLRGFERSDRIYTAMLARGYDGEVRSFPLPPLSHFSILTLIGGLALCSFILASGLVLG